MEKIKKSGSKEMSVEIRTDEDVDANKRGFTANVKVNRPQFAVGVIILVIAAVFLMDKLNLFPNLLLEGLSVGEIILVCILAVAAVGCLIKKQFADVPLPVALLCIILDEQLGLEAISPWPILIAAVLIMIALKLILPNQESILSYTGTTMKTMGTAKLEGGKVQFATFLGNGVKYVISKDLEKAVLKCTLGDMDVFFDKTETAGDTVNVDISICFGDMKLYIPKDRHVECHVRSIIGNCVEDGDEVDTENTVSFMIRGKIICGRLTVVRV